MRTLSALIGRAELARSLGKSFGGKRDLYEAAGYPKEIQYADYAGRYERDGIAARVIDLPVQGVWTLPPTIRDDDDEDNFTQFEQAIEDIAPMLFPALARVDQQSRIGHYAVLLIGDGTPLESAPSNAKLAYLRSYPEARATLGPLLTDTTSPRYGLPQSYNLKLGDTLTKSVHHERIVHVAEDTLDDELHGRPALRPVFNYLIALELIVAGSGEMFWRGGFPGHVASIDKDARLSEQTKKEMSEQLDEYIHGLRRVLRLQGATMNPLAPQVADPQHHVSVLLDLIAGGTGIPKRLLIGSERGELASSQDKANFASLIAERQRNHAEPYILRPTIDRLIGIGALPQPRNGRYAVRWPDPHALSDEERANISLKKAQAMRAAFGPMTESMMPAREFIEELGWTAPDLDDLEPIGEAVEDAP